ncbi:acid protease [Phellopilus nigrolimitatus]|nr:acid protease [Phellopilus nigrolimitatus]
MKLSTYARAADLLFALLLRASSVESVTFPITKRPRSAASLSKRTVDMTGSFGNGSTTVSNSEDTNYSCNITLGGTTFEVLIDTGSVDLWVIGDVPGTKNLSIPIQEAYGKGQIAEGSVNTVELGFDGFTVPDQAYINAYSVDDMPSGSSGILGLGPSAPSTVRRLVNSSAGDPPLDRIFRQNSSTPNFLSILLSRSQDELDGAPVIFLEQQSGQLSIGEIIEGYEAIQNVPKLPALVDQFGNTHWQTVLDANGIIGPDGERIATNTSVENPTVGALDQLHVVFDSGFTFPQVPSEVADAIYGRIPGAEFIPEDNSTGLVNFYQIPCDYELNVTFVFAGAEYPVSPLDLSLFAGDDNEGNPICVSAFQQIAANIAGNKKFGALDAILGMGFLHNTYLLVNFGDFVDGSNSSVADPYIQLLSTTNRSAAHIDFVNVRLNGSDTTGTQAALLPPSQAKHSSTGDTASLSAEVALEKSGNDTSKPFYKTTWFIIVVSVAGVAILALATFSAFAVLRRRRSNVRSENVFVPPMAGMGSYKPLTVGSKSNRKHDDDASYHTEYEEPAYEGEKCA